MGFLKESIFFSYNRKGIFTLPVDTKDPLNLLVVLLPSILCLCSSHWMNFLVRFSTQKKQL